LIEAQELETEDHGENVEGTEHQELRSKDGRHPPGTFGLLEGGNPFEGAGQDRSPLALDL